MNEIEYMDAIEKNMSIHSRKGDRDSLISGPLRELLDRIEAARRDARNRNSLITVITLREFLASITRSHVTDIPGIELVIDRIIPGIDYSVPVRIYHPAPRQALPVALFVHGGGHVARTVGLYDPIARKIAVASDRIVVSVEYRRSPECPYPAALKDTMLCVKNIFSTLAAISLPFKPQLALIGDSGGGALCATVTHLAQFESALNIDQQVLIYPSLDYTLSQASVCENAEGFFLERERILWMFDAYLQNLENRRTISPLFMELTPTFPATLVVTAELDPLRDEGISYVERLRSAGIPAVHLHIPAMIHSFLNLENLTQDACRQTYQAIGSFLREGSSDRHQLDGQPAKSGSGLQNPDICPCRGRRS